MPQNVVGTQVRKLRYERGISQEILAARCGRHGWDVSRGTVAKIEARIRCVSDNELLILARVLNVPLDQLYPPSIRKTKG